MRYQIRHALVQYGADTILEDANFEVRDNEKIAIVGRNGCGKTTLLKLIVGDIQMNNPDSDEECGITMAGKQEIGFLRQVNFEDRDVTVEEEIKKTFAPVFACEKRMEELEERMKSSDSRQLLGEYDSLQKRMEALRGYSWRQDMEVMFQRFGFALEDLSRPIGSFSGGQQTKVAFIKLLLGRPDIMLLDEPTNHLDLPTIEWLEGYLKTYDKAVIIVSHDRMFLDKVVDVTYEIEYHRIKRYPGNYSAFVKRKEEDLIKQEKDYEEQQKEIARLTEWIEKWKNTPSKVAATRSKRMAIEHMVKIEKPRRFDTRAFHARYIPRTESYTNVVQAKRLDIGYDHTLEEITFLLQKKERLAVIGENGKGKSTLLRTLIGEIPALGGEYRFGQNVEWGYFDQQKAVQDGADPEQTVLDNFWEAYPGYLREEVRSALGGFLFSQEDVLKKMGQLSGGEKVRLSLCKMLQTRPNLLILDEPTNHMDIVGKEALEQMLGQYEGTVLFVSHDRYFISRIATGILEFSRDGVKQYNLNYEDYLNEKRREAAGLTGGRSAAGAGTVGRSGGAGKQGDSVGKTAFSSERHSETERRQASGGAGSGGADGLKRVGNFDGAADGSKRVGYFDGAAGNGGSGGMPGVAGNPTLSDIFDKKTYYNPGKIRSRLRNQLEKYERQLTESEERQAELKMTLLDPALATDYTRLMEIQNDIDAEEKKQENLLERMLETETALEEMRE
ncbi:MAG: ABC-F family ATP-binding cassette domain-containing protein [Roseburia sp.]|nr:ABC-F family ATP-binding cassette domain-containing protein [Roseburia sp.]MCM1099124.1 ABC-F family ATP-binding cassette domain-containing protein [Ruminococcus flavefaciens]